MLENMSPDVRHFITPLLGYGGGRPSCRTCAFCDDVQDTPGPNGEPALACFIVSEALGVFATGADNYCQRWKAVPETP